LLEFRQLPRPLWIRRVLVRAQEGQYGRRMRGRFCCGLVLRALRALRIEPRRGNQARQRVTACRAFVFAALCELLGPLTRHALPLAAVGGRETGRSYSTTWRRVSASGC
jgi:hypothetical protein